MFKQCNCENQNCTHRTSIALLLIRIALAVVFISAGSGKLANLAQTVEFFASVGLPAVITYLVAGIELLGGIAMLLGIFTTASGIGIAAVMVGAIFTVHLKQVLGADFSIQALIGAIQLPITLLLTALAAAIAGPGAYTVIKLFGKKKETDAKKEVQGQTATPEKTA